LGRPNGLYDSSLSLLPISNNLSKKINRRVHFSEIITDSPNGTILLKENIRFSVGEEENDDEYAKYLSTLGDVYINDAFSVCHRKHASVSSIYKYFDNDKIFTGNSINNEINILDKLRNNPPRPFITILGGLKVSDKIVAIKKLLKISDKILIGGAMSYCFLKAKGYNVGDFPCDLKDVKLARELLDLDTDNNIILRVDHVVSNNGLKYPEKSYIINNRNIPDGVEGFDIGPATIDLFTEHLKTAKSVFWNGPLGFSEIEEYSYGTNNIANALYNNSNIELCVVGGGDSVSAFNKMGYLENDTIRFLTGGGASMEYLGKGELPGLKL
jgi:3-phosphoglycerate kinase